MNTLLRQAIEKILLPDIQCPAQYLGGELNSARKDPATVRGRICLAFPDTYAIGMSHHGLQVLYHVMNARADWACERAFAPWPDMEAALRRHGLPLYGLETFTPLSEFDLVGFSLQYDLCVTNVLTMLDLGRIPLHADARSPRDPLILAGGPCAFTPEPMAMFIDAFVLGDGETALPEVGDAWLEARAAAGSREAALLDLARRFPFLYVPSLYEPTYDEQGRGGRPAPLHEGVPATIRPATIDELDAAPLPVEPVVPSVEAVQDRIAIEIMRGCPGRCRFCQSTAIKRPIRFRSVDTIVEAAARSVAATGYNELSLLSLSTSDYRDFQGLMARLHARLDPAGVAISVPSLRVNEQLGDVTEQLTTDRHSGLTLAPEAALDDMRQRIGKQVRNEDLMEGCRLAFQRGFDRVKLYFMCGLPDERPADLEGILAMAEAIARLGKAVRGRFPTVVANVSNFVPKPHTPLQWEGMQRREYFEQAHRTLRRRNNLRTVQLKYHDLETSLLEGLLSRGDRRLGRLIEAVWRRGARFDAWSDQFRPELWRQALAELAIDQDQIVHASRPIDASLPWEHIEIPQGGRYLLREYEAFHASRLDPTVAVRAEE